MKLLALLVLLVGCEPAPSKLDATLKAAPRPAPGGAPVTPTASVDCDRLDRQQCLDSTACTLDRPDASGRYVCRPERGMCELALRQDDQKACEARSGCRFEPAQCYCHCLGAGRTKVEDAKGEGCACVCGGGPPSTCVAVAQ